MVEAGIDNSNFRAHSVREAACSKTAGTGVTTKKILEAVDWSSEGTFQQFYHRRLESVDKTSFGKHILHIIVQYLHLFTEYIQSDQKEIARTALIDTIDNKINVLNAKKYIVHNI